MSSRIVSGKIGEGMSYEALRRADLQKTRREARASGLNDVFFSEGSKSLPSEKSCASGAKTPAGRREPPAGLLAAEAVSRASRARDRSPGTWPDALTEPATFAAKNEPAEAGGPIFLKAAEEFRLGPSGHERSSKAARRATTTTESPSDCATLRKAELPELLKGLKPLIMLKYFILSHRLKQAQTARANKTSLSMQKKRKTTNHAD